MEIKLKSTSGNQTMLRQLTRNGQLSNVYLLQTDVPSKELRISKKNFKVIYLDCPGGPRIAIGKTIKSTKLPVVAEIIYNNNIDKYIIIFKS